jgi:hypothetical protein
MRSLKTRIASVSVLAMLTVAAMSTIGLESASAGRGQRAKGKAVNKLSVRGGGGSNSVTIRGGDASASAECEINQNNVGVLGTPSALNTCPVVSTGGALPGPGPGPIAITFPAPGPIAQTNQASGNAGNLAG